MIRRLVLSYVTVAVLVLLCLEIPLGYLYGRFERERVEGQLEHSAEVLAAFADEAIREGRLDDLAVLATESAQQIGGRVVIVDRRGALLSASHPLHREEARPGSLPEVQSALRGRAHIGIRTSMLGGVQSLSVAVPTQPGSTVRGAVRVSVATSTVDVRIRQLWVYLAAGGSAVLGFVTLLAFALARWIGRPVRALERATRHLADGTLPAPASTSTGPAELRRLAATFNRTAARLHHAIEAQRSFAGHASHQLKTPLAALRLRLENLEPDIADEARDNLAAAVTETDRLGRMVEALLAMARLEESSTAPVQVDLDTIVADRERMWAPLAGRRGVRLRTLGDPVGRVYALPDAMEQILDNLLANAMQVTPAGGTIVIRRERGDEPEGGPAVRLHVVDPGPGMSGADRLRAFERFWRAPGAPKGGTGLGLALVQQLTDAGGGHVELRAAPGGGLDAVVTLVPAHHPDMRQESASIVPGLPQASP
jgi:signal transduction histidine kinase